MGGSSQSDGGLCRQQTTTYVGAAPSGCCSMIDLGHGHDRGGMNHVPATSIVREVVHGYERWPQFDLRFGREREIGDIAKSMLIGNGNAPFLFIGTLENLQIW